MTKYKYFTYKEFGCTCGCGRNETDPSLIEKLDQARGISGVPYKINSGFRCEKHNEEVGGSPSSSHKLGLAVDIKAKDSVERYKILRGLLKAGFNRIGIADTFIHVDIDSYKAPDVVWTY